MRIVSVFALLGIFTMARAADFPLVKDHVAGAAIIVGHDASPQIQAAAKTLQTYLEKSTGALLPIQADPGENISLHVGDTDFVRTLSLRPRDLDQDGFILKGVDARNFIIVGGSDWGTEFGVYDFLERFLGVRWLMPTDLGTEVPTHSSLDIPPAEIREEPAYLSRQLAPIEIDRKDSVKPESPWRQYGFQDVWGRYNRARARVKFHHNMTELFAPSKFAASHPEFYPTIDGKKILPKNDLDFHWQPNFSSPGLVDAAVGEIDSYFEKHPDDLSYSLGVNDLRYYDESPESKSRRSGKSNYLGLEDVSDDYFLWANAVVDDVHKRFPGKLFGMLAYSALAEPPKKEGVASGIVPFLTFERMRWADPELRRQDQELTSRWAQEAPAIGWYDYAYGRNYLVPRIWFHLMGEYLLWGQSHQVRYYYAELYPNWGEGPKPWVMAKLLWNPRQNVDALLNDWYVNAVGKEAAPKLAAYFALWEKFWTEDIQRESRNEHSEIPAWNRRAGQYLPFDIVTYLLAVPREYLVKSRQLLDEAENLAETPTQKARVGKIKEMWNIYEASVVAYQDDNLWRTADLTSEADALALLAKCEIGIQNSARRYDLLASLKNDDLLGHSVFRIDQGEGTRGADWGATSLWSLLPWLDKSAEIRKRVEKLSVEGGTAQSKDVASLVLKAAAGAGKPLLKNSSFEEGLQGWDKSPARVSKEFAATGKASAQLVGISGPGLTQSTPISPGRYFAIVRSYISQPVGSEATAWLTLATVDASGKKRGRELPAVRLPFQVAKWSTFILPFNIDKDIARIPSPQLRVSIELSGFGAGSRVCFDDLQVFRLE